VAGNYVLLSVCGSVMYILQVSSLLEKGGGNEPSTVAWQKLIFCVKLPVAQKWKGECLAEPSQLSFLIKDFCFLQFAYYQIQLGLIQWKSI